MSSSCLRLGHEGYQNDRTHAGHKFQGLWSFRAPGPNRRITKTIPHTFDSQRGWHIVLRRWRKDNDHFSNPRRFVAVSGEDFGASGNRSAFGASGGVSIRPFAGRLVHWTDRGIGPNHTLCGRPSKFLITFFSNSSVFMFFLYFVVCFWCPFDASLR